MSAPRNRMPDVTRPATRAVPGIHLRDLHPTLFHNVRFGAMRQAPVVTCSGTTNIATETLPWVFAMRDGY
jgi:hypothetical protein